MVSGRHARKPRGRKSRWILVGVLVLVAAAAGWWFWRNQGLVHPSHVAFGFPGDTVLVHGRSTDLPGSASELPSNDQGLYQRGVSLLGQNEVARASDIFDDLMRRQPRFGLSFFYAARIHLFKATHSDSVQADALLTRGLAGDPGQPWLLLQSAQCHMAAGQLKEARVLLEKALDFAPDFREAMEELARVELKSENYERAQRLAQLSISLAKGGSQARYDLIAEILFAREKDDSATKALERGLEQNPKQARYHWLRGLIAESHGDTTSARQDYQQALQIGRLPEAEEALRTLGLKPLHGLGRLGIHLGEGTGDPDYLLSLLLPLSRSYPQNAPVWYAIGRAYNTKGLYAQADECFQKALSQDSTVPGLRDWWGQNRLALEEKARVFNAARSGKDISHEPDNNWYDLGHYRIPWGTSHDVFLGQFPPKRFEPHGTKLVESRSAWGIHYVHEVLFDASGLWGVRVTMSNDGKAGLDLMEEGIRQNVLQAGSGSFLDPIMCSSLGQVDAVVWENSDSYEIMVKAARRPKHLFLLRMKPDRVPDGGTCAAAVMAADSTR